MDKSYHHGDLKNALIEAGIEFINQYGSNQLSLRKLAAKCSVSHAAPYNHFKDKDDLLKTIQDYVIDKFSSVLETTITEHKESPDFMIHLGKTYIYFFVENPKYYQFIYSQNGVNFSVEFNDNVIISTDFPPFELFKNTAIECMKRRQVPLSSFTENIIAMWAIVHGMASIFTFNGMNNNKELDNIIGIVLTEKFCLS